MSSQTKATGFSPEEHDESWLRMWVGAQKPTPPDISKVIAESMSDLLDQLEDGKLPSKGENK